MQAVVQAPTRSVPSSTECYERIFSSQLTTALKGKGEAALFEGKSGVFGYIPHADCAGLLGQVEAALLAADGTDASETLPLRGRVLVDMGSGDGRVVVSAALLRPELARVVGVELSPTRHAAAAAHVRALAGAAAIEPGRLYARAEVICADMLAWDGLAEADVVFANSLCVGDTINRRLEAKLDDELPRDRTVIVAVAGAKLRFKRLHTERSGLVGQSWGASPLYIYTLPPTRSPLGVTV